MVARSFAPLLTILVSWCVLTDLARAESHAAPQWGWPDEPPSGADCVARSGLEQRIEEQLGGPLSEADFALSFTANIERTRDGFRLVLVTEQDGQRGERTFEGATCREVSDAAVLLIALSIDDARAKEGSTSETAAPAHDGPEPATAPSEPREPGAPPNQHPRQRWGLRAGGLLDGGTLPRVAAGFELGVHVAWARSRVSLTAVGLPPVRSERSTDGSRVEVSLWAARLGYCHTLLSLLPLRDGVGGAGSPARVELGGCLGFELGAELGRGIDLREAKHPSFVWAAGWVALRVALALSARWALSLEPALALPSKRGRFVSRDAQGRIDDELFTPALLAKRLSLAVELSF